MYKILRERPADAGDIEQLLDLAFGPDRLAKTSYRYRDGVAPVSALSWIARDGERLVGTIRYWPIQVGAADALRRYLASATDLDAADRRLLEGRLAAMDRDLAGAAPVEATPTPRQEERLGATLGMLRRRLVAHREVGFDGLDGDVAERDEALAIALADDADEAAAEGDVLAVEPEGFADA